MMSPVMREYFVYILTNVPRGTLYVGVTNDLLRRTYEHRERIVSGFTSRYKLKVLVHFEQYADPTNGDSAREKHQALVARLEAPTGGIRESPMARSL
jgi:predicted GIY-YIG superfamily endonuclease